MIAYSFSEMVYIHEKKDLDIDETTECKDSIEKDMLNSTKENMEDALNNIINNTIDKRLKVHYINYGLHVYKFLLKAVDCRIEGLKTILRDIETEEGDKQKFGHWVVKTARPLTQKLEIIISNICLNHTHPPSLIIKHVLCNISSFIWSLFWGHENLGPASGQRTFEQQRNEALEIIEKRLKEVSLCTSGHLIEEYHQVLETNLDNVKSFLRRLKTWQRQQN